MNNLIKKIVESKFNFNIDIEDNKIQDSLSKSKYNSISLKKLYLDLYIVDLGLPSGTLWCKYNLGVDIYNLSKSEDWYGDYYAWGEIETKDVYMWKTYKYGVDYNKLSKYCTNPEYGGYERFEDNLNELLLEDDAAYLNLSIGQYKFKTPTKLQLDELLEQTRIKWVENYNDINRLNGVIFISKTNGNEMFIPTAGYFYNSELYNAGVIAYLRSSNLNTDYISYAWSFNFDSKWAKICNYSRCYGVSVRPVLYTN